MKYPQLVSTRAVNAISDWLVSRLEQLGVEAPQIYTRLLLSLLQSSVQINDPIEFNSLETFIGSRKGGNSRRYLQCDANTLKKLNAIQCLSEIVSSEQELTTIENLVDELWEKLKDIEKQIDYSYCDEAILADNSGNSAEALKYKRNTTSQLADHVNAKFSSNCNCNNNNEKKKAISGNITTTVELETDPKKRYFNAFPALSKEMEDSFRIWRRNAKSLTWPADRRNILNSSSSCGSNLSNSFETKCDKKSANSHKSNDLNVSKQDNLPNSSNNIIVSSTVGLKRKSKRRKSQSMSKGRTMPNTRKTAFNDNVMNAFSTTGSAGVNRKQNRHMSPTQWDTDFEGYWEMGRDLIKEFFAKQNESKDNRCNSANGAYSVNQSENMTITNHDSTGDSLNKETLPLEKCNSPPLMPNVDISFCCEDSVDDDDTYNSIAELTADSLALNSLSSPRRLYQRLVLPESEGQTSINDVQSDFMQFKAKFNSNLAALWENASDDENTNYDESSLWAAPSNIPWPTVAPIKENLKNFWTNFYNHQFELAKVSREQESQTRLAYDSVNIGSNLGIGINDCISLPYCMPSSSNSSTKINSSVDYRSMPFTMEGFDKVDGDMSGSNKNHSKPDGRRTPIGVFLQDSIWSENLNGGKNTDTDESFYMKVWNSNKKLYNLDAIYEKKMPETPNESKLKDQSFEIGTYGNSKWSEGINAGPISFQQQNMKLSINNCIKNDAFSQQNMCSTEFTEASISAATSCSSSSHTLSSSGVFSGQTPSLQSNLQSSDNTKSLTEMYGINSPIDNSQKEIIEESKCNSPISLSNHSSQSSGFVEFSRLKSLSQSLRMENIKQQQHNYHAQILRPKEQRYPDDENLLTSEHTHFQPIRAYKNGYTFDVCSALEVINYKRSESGYLYYESEKYLEYTRKDPFMAEEETNAAVSTTPLYAGSNCEAAISQKRQKEHKAEELVLKFRLMNHDIACQTDDEDTVNKMYASSQLQHPLYLLLSGADSEGIKIPNTNQVCSGAIEALNKAVAAAAKAAAERDRMKVAWSRLNEVLDTSRNSIGSSLIWTAAQASPHEDIGVDEIDFYNESSCTFGNTMEQQWSMQNINKRCQMNEGICLVGVPSSESHLRSINSVNNNLIGTHQTNTDMHSLWGMCAACNSDYKSAPANHLLRDELKLEADQIMSDLKNMQDLYIGCSTETQGDSSDSDCNSDYFWGRNGNEQEKIPKNIKHPYPIAIRGCTEVDTIDKNMLNNEDSMELRQKETQQKVLQQVNKLIADLMRPEKANNTNLLAHAAASAHRELGESLWPDDGEHNIWKQQFESCSRSGSENEKYNSTALTRPSRNSVLGAEEKKFLAQLTWEHDNLAEIWAKTTPPLISKTTPPQQELQPLPSSNPPISMCSATNDAYAKQRRSETFENIQHKNDAMADTENNSKQHQHADEIKSSSILNENSNFILTGRMDSCRSHDVHLAPSAAAYKRTQQFLNSTVVANNVTTAKLKLANRKRRHSASQNYTILHNSGLGGGNGLCSSSQKSNNNNNIKISDMNNYNLKRNHASTIANANTNANDKKFNPTEDTASATVLTFTDDVDMLDQGIGDSSAYFLIKNGDNMILPPPKQTIITCKYWTTIDPMMDTDVIECTEGTTFSCLVDKNDAILKHVTMLARPLTR